MAIYVTIYGLWNESNLLLECSIIFEDFHLSRMVTLP